MAAEETGDKGRKQLEEEVWSAIGAFEQILEAMPEDRASLETLSHAYGQIGDHARAYEYVLRLGRVLLVEGDSGTGVVAGGPGRPDRQRVLAFWEAIRSATTHRIAGRIAEAAADYQRAVELDPRHEDALYYIGNMRFELGEYARAGEWRKGWPRRARWGNRTPSPRTPGDGSIRIEERALEARGGDR